MRFTTINCYKTFNIKVLLNHEDYTQHSEFKLWSEWDVSILYLSSIFQNLGSKKSMDDKWFY